MITTCTPVHNVMDVGIERVIGNGSRLSLSRPLVMGIVNATPDSFFDGGMYDDKKGLADRIDRLLDEGADLVDIGGESTRPGATPVTPDEELARILRAVEHALDAGAFVSVDTRRPGVARTVLGMGAHMINCVGGIASPELRSVIAEKDAAVVIMHMKGDPATMQADPTYDDVVREVRGHLSDQVELGLEAGIGRESIVVDPGIGFGKTLEHNLALLSHLDRFLDIGQPVLVGTSRKSVIGKVLDLPPGERLEGSVASCVVALTRGASMFRVHDVLETRRALDMAHAIL